MARFLALALASGAAVAAAAAPPAPSLQSFGVVVYGATPAGIMAALAAAGEGLTVALVHPLRHVGGMMTGGLGRTDVGDESVIGGAAGAFFEGVSRAYNRSGRTYLFEPHVAEAVFMASLAAAGPRLALFVSQTLTGVSKSGATLTAMTTADTAAAEAGAPSPATYTYVGSAFIDASYEGDLLAAAGVPFTVGREPSAQYNESLGGRLFVPNRVGGHQFNVPINYTLPSGELLPGISAADPGAPGDGDARVQAYNFRLCLTTDPANRVPFTRPPGYDPAYWELLRRYVAAANITAVGSLMGCSLLGVGGAGKTDCNNNGPVSTDFIGGGAAWPGSTPAQRAALWAAHRDYTLGFLWTLASDPALPAALREEASALGFAADEWVDSGNFPAQLYVREGRRMVGPRVFTQADRTQPGRMNGIPDSVGLYSYNIDNHNAQRFPQGAYVRNEGDEQQFGDLGPGQMPYSLMVPPDAAAANLLVPVAVSASHAGFGAIRLEPQWMILVRGWGGGGSVHSRERYTFAAHTRPPTAPPPRPLGTQGQSAGVAAAQAVAQGVGVSRVDMAQLQSRLVALGQKLKLPVQ